VHERYKSQKAQYKEFEWDNYYRDKNVAIVEIGAGTQYQAIRCISEDILDKFGPKKAKLVRINPERGIASVFGVHAVEYIEEANFEERIKDTGNKEIEIMWI
jgi:hypothetical protein